MIKLSTSKLAWAAALLTLVGALAMAGPAAATVIDFEATPLGTYNSLTFGPVTITFLAGNGNYEVQDQNPGPPVSGHVLISFFTNAGPGSFQATFAGGTNNVSIAVNDFAPSDTDDVHLRAYDAANNLLDSDFLVIPANGPGVILSVSSGTLIARVEWNETGDNEGAVYWDNLTYDATQAVPGPQPLLLLTLSLAIAGFVGRRLRVTK